MKNILVVLLLIFCTITYGQNQSKIRRGFISYDSSIHTSGVTFQDSIYYTGQTATDTLLWMGANSITKALYLDTTKTSSFALYMDLDPIDTFMLNIHNGELRWYYMDNGKIQFEHGWAENISNRYQQLMAGIEIGYRYTYDQESRIKYLETTITDLENRLVTFGIGITLVLLIFLLIILFLVKFK